jgi:prolyl oligopeptidase
MFIANRKATPRDKNQPVLMTGYGGFNVSMRPQFSASTAAWIESGGTAVLVVLRGGGEFGEAWHRAGMLDKKQNVFDDFIGAAQYLIQQGYTNPSRLAIAGGSNGGLLVGTALTQRPDLFRAVVCFYPLLDMIRYDKFKIAKAWVPEYGTADDAQQFQYLLRYSPYQHVKAEGKYPAVMFATGDGDTRVDPLHARKMAALLQASTASGLPVLLRYDKESGHSGGLSVSNEIELQTDVLAFLCEQLGVKP